MTTITERIAQCASGAVIMLDSDTSEVIVTPEGRDFVLDLGGHTLTAPAGETPLKVLGSRVVVRNGTIRSTGGGTAVRVGMEDYDKVSFARLEEDVMIVSADRVGLFLGRNAIVESMADISNESLGFAAICGNGMAPFWPNKLTIYGGRVHSPDTAIYWPQVGELRIMGGEIEGITGVEIRAGELYMQGGTVTGTGVPTGISANGNGTTSTGCGIAIAQHTTKQRIRAVITGGTVRGYSALYESNPQNNPAEDIAKVKPQIIRGNFEAINGGTVAVYSQDCTGFIEGGRFNTAVDKGLCMGDFEVLQQPDGSFAAEHTSWVYPDGGAVGGGMLNLRRLIMTRERHDYAAGGIPASEIGFEPYMVLAVSAKGGLTGYFDPVARKIVLYRGTKEVTGTVEDLRIVLLGH